MNSIDPTVGVPTEALEPSFGEAIPGLDPGDTTAAGGLNKLNWDVGADIIVLNENVVSQTLTLLDT